jgi:tetratricopeptide (TPR) repeat protein
VAVVFLRQEQWEAALGQFESGLNLGAQGGPIPDLELAVSELRKAISRNPKSAEARNTLGRLLGLAGADTQQIVATFEEAIRLQPDLAEAHNNLGLVYTQSGDDVKAAAAFREAVRLRPDFADAHQNLGTLLITSDAGEAVRELERALAIQPTLQKAQYNLALAYEANPSDGPAREIAQLQKLLTTNPKYPRAEFTLGKALLKTGKLEEAVKHLQTAVADDPKFGEAYYQLGLALSRSGRKTEGSEAMAKSREYLAANERDQMADLELREGRALLEAGKSDEALARFQRLTALKPDAPDGQYYLGLSLRQKGETAQAAAAFRRALDLRPGYAEARNELERVGTTQGSSGDTEAVEAAISQGNFTEAERLLQRYIETHPKSSWAWYALGYSYYGQHKLGESIKALAQSLQLDVKNAEAHKVLGRDLMMIGRFDAARVEFEQGARYDPKSAEMPYNLGKLYSIQDSWALAKQSFERALTLDPSYMEAHDGLGLALESLGDKNAAIASYQRAIDLSEARHAKFSAPYVNMSALYNQQGDSKTALDFARRALAVNPSSDRALYQMAKAYERDGATAAAVDSLNRAVAINPQASSYFYMLATVYRRLGKAEESRKAMETFSKLSRLSNELEQKRIDWFKEDGNRGQMKPGPGGSGDQ